MSVLEDVFPANLRVVFCGTAAGKTSAALGAYYAKSNNRFWSELHRIGLTPRRLNPTEYKELSKYGIGLTDLAKNTSGTDSELSERDFDTLSFVEKVEQRQPKVVAFTSKKAASVFLKKRTNHINYGFQEQIVGKTRLFVLTSTSGQNGHWTPEPWDLLATELKTLSKA